VTLQDRIRAQRTVALSRRQTLFSPVSTKKLLVEDAGRESRRFFPCWLPCCALPWCTQRPHSNRRRGGLLRRWFAYELCTFAFCAAIAAAVGIRLLVRVGNLPGDDDAIGPQRATARALGGGNLTNTSSGGDDSIAYALEEERAVVHSALEWFSVAWGRLGELESMQFRAAIFWCRVLYGLLSLPFVVFTLPLFFEAFTHSRPTGYTERGDCVRCLTARERTVAAKKAQMLMEQRSQERMSMAKRKASVARLCEKYHAPSSTSSLASMV
jgi:hypothetical protein